MTIFQDSGEARTGREFVVGDSRQTPGSHKVVVRGLTKRFGTVTAVDNVDLEIYDGEFLTLLGPSGCGKTTLMRVIAGLEHPDQGRVFIDGRDVTDLPPRQRRLGMVFQQYALFPHMTVHANVAYGLDVTGRPRREIDDQVARMLELVRLVGYEERFPSQLSGGQQQRVALARALATEPEVLMLDEPLGALDLQLRRGLQLELRRIHRETGVTFLYVTHDQEEALHMSDRIGLMQAGTFEQLDEPEVLYEHPRSAFVAEFVGDVTLLRCVADPQRGDRVHVKGTDATVQLGATEVPNGEFDLVVRPEAVTLSTPDAHPADGALVGIVEDTQYAGGESIITIRLDGGQLLKAKGDSRAGRAFLTGDAINLRIEGATTCLPV